MIESLDIFAQMPLSLSLTAGSKREHGRNKGGKLILHLKQVGKAPRGPTGVFFRNGQYLLPHLLPYIRVRS